MMLRFVLALALGLGLSFAPTASAEIVVLNPVHDSYVDAFAPDSNFDSIILVSGRDDNIPVRQQSYLRFDLPASGTITKAVLKLESANCAVSSNPALGHDLFLVTDDSWLESTLTWNNRPAEGANTGARYPTAVSCAAGSDFIADITSFVVQEAAGDGAISLLVRLEPETLPMGESQNLVLWFPRETATPPELTLTVIQNVPALGRNGVAALVGLFTLSGFRVLNRRGPGAA